MSSTRVIKKYPNRRLYDTTTNAYVTLEEIKKLVLDRVELQVIDARTKKDLTQITLFQIISEQENTATPLFTINVLQDFIRFYHEKSQNMLSQYLEESMRLFHQQKEFYTQQWAAYQQLVQPPQVKKPRSTKKLKK